MQRCGLPLQHSDATVTSLAITPSVPPRVAAIGLARGIKTWQAADVPPTDDVPIQFREGFEHVPSEVPGSRVRVAHAAIHGRLLVLVDSATSANITIWNCANWQLLQTIQVALDEGEDAPSKPVSVSSLAFDGTHIAVGTHCGHCRTWKQPVENTDFVIMLAPLLVDPAAPVTHVMASGGLLCCFCASKQTFVAWKLEDGRLLHAWSADKVSGSRPLVHAAMVENLVASVHVNLGTDDTPSVQVLDLLTGDGGRIADKGILGGEGDALCLAFSGDLICLGFANGAVVVFDVANSYEAWKRYHQGAVGCVAVVPAEGGGECQRVITGGADRRVNLWDKSGDLVSAVELGAQPRWDAHEKSGAEIPFLTVHPPKNKVCGMEMLQKVCEMARDVSRPQVTSVCTQHPRIAACGTNRGFVEVVVLPSEGFTTPNSGQQLERPHMPTEYDQYFEDTKGKVFRVKDAPEAFSALMAPSDDSLPECSMKAADGKGGKTDDAAVATLAKGLQGAFSKKGGGLVTKEEEERTKQEEAKSKDTSRPDLGDSAGVARCAEVPKDESLKCGSLNCIARAVGRKKFLRCGRCKQVWYCSQHCQRTHWRDGHKTACVVVPEPASSAKVEDQSVESVQAQPAVSSKTETVVSGEIVDTNAKADEMIPQEREEAENDGTSEVPDSCAQKVAVHEDDDDLYELD